MVQKIFANSENVQCTNLIVLAVMQCGRLKSCTRRVVRWQRGSRVVIEGYPIRKRRAKSEQAQKIENFAPKARNLKSFEPARIKSSHATLKSQRV